MSQVIDPVGNVFAFVCNCGYSRMVVDTEINFRCERPVVDASEKKCTFYYQMVPNGVSTGVPTVHRVNSSGVNQSDDAALVQSTASAIPGDSVADNSVDGLSIASDGAVG